MLICTKAEKEPVVGFSGILSLSLHLTCHHSNINSNQHYTITQLVSLLLSPSNSNLLILYLFIVESHLC